MTPLAIIRLQRVAFLAFCLIYHGCKENQKIKLHFSFTHTKFNNHRVQLWQVRY